MGGERWDLYGMEGKAGTLTHLPVHAYPVSSSTCAFRLGHLDPGTVEVGLPSPETPQRSELTSPPFSSASSPPFQARSSLEGP